MKNNLELFKLLVVAIAFLVCNYLPVNAAPWQKVIQRQKLIIAVKNNLPPLAYTDNNGNLQGLEIDIAKRLATELLGNPSALILVPVNNSQRLQIVIDDQVDMAIASVTVTTSRQRLVDFSPYYYFDSTAIITKKSNLLSNFQLTKAKIAVLENSSTIAVMQYELPNTTLIIVKSYQEALSLLENEQVDGFASDKTLLTGWVQQYPKYQILPHNWSGYPLAIVLPKGLQYQELRKKVSEAIARWQKEGWLEERAKFWGL